MPTSIAALRLRIQAPILDSLLVHEPTTQGVPQLFPELRLIWGGTAASPAGSSRPRAALVTCRRFDVMMGHMASPKRSTIYFDPDLHRALRLKAAATDRSISDVVNEAVRQTLSEDAADLEMFERRRREPGVDFEEVVLRLRRSGKL